MLREAWRTELHQRLLRGHSQTFLVKGPLALSFRVYTCGLCGNLHLKSTSGWQPPFGRPFCPKGMLGTDLTEGGEGGIWRWFCEGQLARFFSSWRGSRSKCTEWGSINLGSWAPEPILSHSLIFLRSSGVSAKGCDLSESWSDSSVASGRRAVRSAISFREGLRVSRGF